MMRRLIRSSVGLLVVATFGVVLSSVAGAAPISNTGSIVQPLDAQGCAGNVCMYLSSPSDGTVYVQAWAYYDSEYGQLQLSAPSGTYNSPTQVWDAGGPRHTFPTIPAIVGQYCVTLWDGGVNSGTACENVE